jgi:hypothetical protein
MISFRTHYKSKFVHETSRPVPSRRMKMLIMILQRAQSRSIHKSSLATFHQDIELEEGIPHPRSTARGKSGEYQYLCIQPVHNTGVEGPPQRSFSQRQLTN